MRTKMPNRVRQWSEEDTKKKWYPVFIGELEELLLAVNTITLTFGECDGLIAWGGEPEIVCEAIQRIGRKYYNKEFAYLYDSELPVVWESVWAFLETH